jgi:hypothetical protein
MKTADRRKLPDPKAGKRKQLAKPAERTIAKPEPESAKEQSTITLTQAEVQKYGPMLNHPGMLEHSLGRVLGIMRQKGADLPTQHETNFGIDAFVGLVPDGPGEMMLCQQMIAAHEMAMCMLTRSKQADNLSLMQEYGLMGVKMMGAYERLFQTLMKTRRPQQTVRVEHVHVYEGGQAVVGNVNQRPAIAESQAASQVAAESAAMRVIEGST